VSGVVINLLLPPPLFTGDIPGIPGIPNDDDDPNAEAETEALDPIPNEYIMDIVR
jgi:hypothetical protein